MTIGTSFISSQYLNETKKGWNSSTLSFKEGQYGIGSVSISIDVVHSVTQKKRALVKTPFHRTEWVCTANTPEEEVMNVGKMFKE